MQAPLAGSTGGKAPVVSAKVVRRDADRLARLAARRRTTPSALMREALGALLDQLEPADTGPPAEGG